MEQKNNLGLIAMIIGIVSVVLSIFGDAMTSNAVLAIILVFVALAAGIVAMVLGVKARKDPTASRGMATAGMVTGIVGTVYAGISVACVICCVACAAGVSTMV